MEIKAYTYYLFHKPTGLKYYGVRYKKGCRPEDLFDSYFTSSKEIHKLISKYGVKSFEIEIRKLFDNVEKAKLWECKVLKRLNVLKKTEWVNKSIGKAPSTKGYIHSKETKIKMSNSQLGEKNHMFGKTHSKEAKQKISESVIGRVLSEESKTKIKEKMIGHPQWFFNHSKESKTKIKKARANQVFTEEDRKKMSESAKGRKWYKDPDTGKRIFYRDNS